MTSLRCSNRANPRLYFAAALRVEQLTCSATTICRPAVTRLVCSHGEDLTIVPHCVVGCADRPLVAPTPCVGVAYHPALRRCASLWHSNRTAHQHAVQSYRKAVTAARKDKKPDKRQGLTEEQKQEIRCCTLIPIKSSRVIKLPPPPPPRSLRRLGRREHSQWRALTRRAPCREAFDLFDTDGSGTIDAKELKVAMR